MNTRDRAYDWRLKVDALNGVIPDPFKSIIKPYHIYRWRKEKFHKVIGFNYYNQQETDLQELNKTILSQESELKIIRAENELYKVLVNSISNHNEYNHLIRKYKKEICDCITKVRAVLGVKNCTKLIKIDTSTHTLWRQELIADCSHSISKKCVKTLPKTLTTEEENQIISLLKDPRYFHYPISSLKWKAHHEGLVHASFDTWSRFKRKYKIDRKQIKKGRRKKYFPLKAKYPNQYLHADITYFKVSRTQKKYAIFIVKDNYSKYIKSWRVSVRSTSDIRLETFKESVKDIESEVVNSISFITDGGNENKSNSIKRFFNKLSNVWLLCARKDIPYSNSMVERYNNDLKYMYLFREDIRNIKQLRKAVEHAVNEHNNYKRLNCLMGQTPFEAYHQFPIKNLIIKEEWDNAKKDRIKKNMSHNCCVKNEKMFDYLAGKHNNKV